MEKKRKRLRSRMKDQEIMEQCVQRFTLSSFTLKQFWSIQEGRLELWKKTLIGIFLVGPFVVLFPIISWFGRISLRDVGLLLGIHAAFLISISSFYHLMSVRGKVSEQERLSHFLSLWFFSILSWVAFWTSLMALVGSIGAFVRIPGVPWWIPVLIYIAGIMGLWLRRKEILRIIIEGPGAHPWFRPVYLLFSVPLGFCIFSGVVLRIFLNWVEQFDVNLALSLLTALLLGFSIIAAGLSIVGLVIARLHYQRWIGVSELKA